MLTVAQLVLIPLALGAVALVLLLGLANMARGGSPQRAQALMRWRIGLQFVAFCLVLATVFFMHQG